MKKLFVLMLLLCTALQSAWAVRTNDVWQEMDTLIARGHYTSAYEKGEKLLRKAMRKGDSHSMLKAIYKQRMAASFYQEEHIETSIKAYQDIAPMLRGADKSIAYMLLSVVLDDYKNRYLWRNGQAKSTIDLPPLSLETLLKTSADDLSQWSEKRFSDAKRLCYETALAEEKSLKATKTEDYDLLTKGDTLGLRLRPTLYDVVVHTMTDRMYLGGNDTKRYLFEQRDLLFGTAEEFISLRLPSDTLSYELWQLHLLQVLTRHHLKTDDAAVRAHIDHKRIEKLKPFAHLRESYASGLERIAESYGSSPTEQAMFLFLLADYYKPAIYEHSEKEVIEQELKKAEKMAQYIKRIHRIAPDSKWAKTSKALYKRATHPFLKLQSHTTVLPERESSITITLRNAGDVAYRIVPRYANESTDNFSYREVIGRKSVGKVYVEHPEYSNPYIYKKVELLLPSLDAGDYFVIATNNGKSDDTKRSSITAITVSNLKLSMMLNEAEGEYIGMVIDATTGQAVTDCEVTLIERTNKQTHFIEEYSIDEKGYFTMPLPTGKYRNLCLLATDGASQATYSLRYADFPESRYRGGEEVSTLFTFLPDRYTYEPGDTVHFGLIAYSHREEGSRVKSHLPVGVSLKDARGKEVASLQGTTDEWGRFSDSFTIPEGITAGRFILQATDKQSSRTMHHMINVEAFKAPTFKAEIERPKGTVRFGDSLTLQGIATTFTELPVGGAKVKYELLVTDMNIFGRYPLQDAYLSETSGTTTTDEKGYFYIPIKATCFNMPEENATQNYIVTAHITDINGETQTTKTNFAVGHRTKHIEFAQPRVFRHGDNIAYSLRTLNGERITEKVSLRLCKLKAPQSAKILHYEESSREQWEEEHTYIHRTEQTALDKDNHILLSKDLPYGIYRLTATYTDGNKQHSEVCHLELWGEGKGAVSSYTLYQTRVESHEVQAGDTAMLYVGTRYSDVFLHYYIKVGDRVMNKGTLCLNDEMTSLRIPIKEEWKGRMRIDIVSVKENVRKVDSWIFSIENKSELLDVHLSSMRNHLEPGETEQCTISIKDYRGNPVQSSFILSIYDAALDGYGENRWDITPAPVVWGRSVETEDISVWAWDNNTHINVPRPNEPKYYTLPNELQERQILYSLAAPTMARGQAKNHAGFDMATAEELNLEIVENSAQLDEAAMQLGSIAEDSGTSGNIEAPTHYLRTNLSHTALFLPTLHTDEQGQATFTLTAPDLLSRWHVKGIAHTKDMKHGCVESSFVTRKTLMVQPNVPRFLYEGDVCDFTAKVSNSSNEPMEVVVKLEVNATTLQDTLFIEAGSSTSVSFPIAVPDGATSLTYRITAHNTLYSDGEQASISILPRRSLVTETMALYLNGNESREFLFTGLRDRQSETLEHHSLTLEIVSNPLWYAIDALPSLSKEGNPSYERLFHRYYAVSLAHKLLVQYPEIADNTEHTNFYNADTLAVLQQELLNKLATGQNADGSWPWMEGFAPDRYTTLLIIKGMGELEAMGSIGVATSDTLYTMVKRAIGYLDHTYYDSFAQLKRRPKALDSYALYYLYVRSLFPEIPFGDTPRDAYKHYTQLLFKDKATQGTLIHKAMKMLTLLRMGHQQKASEVAEVVRQSSLQSDEMGVFWRDNTYCWGSNPIATQAMLIESFARFNQPANFVGRMQQWLLKQKQTTEWTNSIATAQAVYALVGGASTGRRETLTAENVQVQAKHATLRAISDDKHSTVKYEVLPKQERGNAPTIPLHLERAGTTSLPAWGSLTWQYYEEATKVQPSGTGLTLKCSYYKVEHRDGKEVLTPLPTNPQDAESGINVGDRIRVRLQFTADRVMDYVELSQHRPAALEPVTTRSGYTYSNGLVYYQSVENTRTTLYFYRINKGNYFVDYDLWVSHSGDFSCGLSTIQCMYAPEFVATDSAGKIKVRG